MQDFDHHSMMNADSFEDWFVSRFLNYLHGINHNYGHWAVKVPNAESQDNQKWLRRKSTEHDTTETLVKLLLRGAQSRKGVMCLIKQQLK